MTVSSLGGDARQGLIIARALRARAGRVEATIRGIAASAAVLPLCAARRVAIEADAVTMIHDPACAGPACGTPGAAAELARIRDEIIDVLGWRVRGGRDAIARMMSATTWWDAREAVAAGLADAIIPASLPVAACLDARALATLEPIPARFRGLIDRFRARAIAESWRASHSRIEGRRGLDVAGIYHRLNGQAAALPRELSELCATDCYAPTRSDGGALCDGVTCWAKRLGASAGGAPFSAVDYYRKLNTPQGGLRR